MMSKPLRLLDQIGLLVLPAMAAVRGEGMQKGYFAAIRDLDALRAQAISEGASEDEIDVLQFLVTHLSQNAEEYGFND